MFRCVHSVFTIMMEHNVLLGCAFISLVLFVNEGDGGCGKVGGIKYFISNPIPRNCNQG